MTKNIKYRKMSNEVITTFFDTLPQYLLVDQVNDKYDLSTDMDNFPDFLNLPEDVQKRILQLNSAQDIINLGKSNKITQMTPSINEFNNYLQTKQ